MNDHMGRTIEYLRLSVTWHCNLNCIYCKPPNSRIEQKDYIISVDQYRTIISAMADIGIKKVRITGGEPLLRSDICDIIRAVSKTPGIEDVSLTTNAILLAPMAFKLKEAGLNRVNISLDSLKDDSFGRITGGGSLKKVWEGIEQAVYSGLNPVKTNTVLIRGENSDEIDNLISLARDFPIDVRFIELMPVGEYGSTNTEKRIPSEEIIASRPHLTYVGGARGSQPADYYRIEGYKGRIGFISPMSHKFCSSCNRVRLTYDGKLKTCIGDNNEQDIMDVLAYNPNGLKEYIRNIVYTKPCGHNFGEGFASERSMDKIGG